VIGDTWTRASAWARRALRWTCPQPCGAINPEITSKCLRCGK
jgi:hypothetical protein